MKYLPFFVLVALLFLPARSTFAQRGTHVNMSINGKRTYIVKNDRIDLEIELRGDIELNAQETEVVRISPGGYLEIDERIRRGERHQLRLKGEAGGRLSQEYKRNGRRVDIENMDRDWYAGVLQHIIRETGIDAENRVERLLAKGGVDAVLDEVALIESNASKSRYLTHLFDKAEVSGRRLDRVAKEIASISSSGDRSRLLIAASVGFLNAEGNETTYFDLVRSISSSGDKTRVLLHVVEARLLRNDAAYEEAIDAAGSISSSGDRSRFLIAAAELFVEHAPDVYFEAIAGVPSSGDKARTLQHLVERDLLDDPPAYLSALNAAPHIQSGGDRTRFLMAAAPGFTGEARDAYFRAVDSISSQGDRARVLINLLDVVSLDDASIAALLESAGRISGSGDKARVLLAASDRVEGRDELVAIYLEVAETISSTGDQRRVLEALLN